MDKELPNEELMARIAEGLFESYFMGRRTSRMKPVDILRRL
jgi:hypothetical protein